MFYTETSGNRGPVDDFWYTPISWDRRHGRVSPDMGRRLSIVFACIKVLAETTAQLPLFLYRRRPDGGKERVFDHPAAKLMRQQPNAWQTSYKFRELLQHHLGLRGNAYALKTFDQATGEVLSLTPLNPDKMQPQRIVGKMALKYVYTDPDNNEITYRQSEILHLRGLSDDGLVGLNPMEVENRAISFGLTTQDFGQRFYENDASAGGWIEFPGKFESREAKQKFRETFQEAQTGRNRGKYPILDNGLKLHDLPIKATDAQFLETRKYSDVDICRIFRVPQHKVGILDRSTNNNIEQQGLEFITDTMMPILVNWEEQLSLDILNADEQEEYFFEFLVDGMLRGDSTARSNYFNKAITTGWMTRNEARIIESLNPLPGLDEPLQMVNMTVAGEEPDPDDGADTDTPTPAGDPATDTQEENAPQPNGNRMKAMERQAASYLVRREIQNARGLYGKPSQAGTRDGLERFYTDHEGLVVKTLAVSPAVATAYAQASKDELLKALDAENEGAAGAYKAVLDRWARGRINELLKQVHAHA